MKRFLFAAVLMLAISAFAAPVFAMDTCEHDMTAHDPTAASLVAHVQHATEMGHIKKVLVPSLTAPLGAAANETLPVASRVGALQAFIDLVNAQAGKGVESECAVHLVTHAQHVMAALNGQM